MLEKKADPDPKSQMYSFHSMFYGVLIHLKNHLNILTAHFFQQTHPTFSKKKSQRICHVKPPDPLDQRIHCQPPDIRSPLWIQSPSACPVFLPGKRTIVSR